MRKKEMSIKSSTDFRYQMEEWIVSTVFQLLNGSNSNEDAAVLWKLANTYDRIATTDSVKISERPTQEFFFPTGVLLAK
jgi:hypothetical protein